MLERETMSDQNRLVLAYSGGLDTSVAISYLKERTGKDVVAVSLDVGQGGESLETIKAATRWHAVRSKPTWSMPVMNSQRILHEGPEGQRHVRRRVPAGLRISRR